MNTYLFKIKQRRKHDSQLLMETGNGYFAKGYRVIPVQADTLDEAAELFGMGYDDVEELEAAE